MIELSCQQENHEFRQIIGVCIFEKCHKRRLCCLACIKEFHSNHCNEVIEISELESQVNKSIGQIINIHQWVQELVQFQNEIQELGFKIYGAKVKIQNVTKYKLQFLGNENFDSLINQLFIIKQIETSFVKMKDFSFDQFKNVCKEIKTLVEQLQLQDNQSDQIQSTNNLSITLNDQQFVFNKNDNYETQSEYFLQQSNQLNESTQSISQKDPIILINSEIFQTQENLNLGTSQIFSSRRSGIRVNQILECEKPVLQWNLQSQLREKIFLFIKNKFSSPQFKDERGIIFKAQRYDCSIYEGYTNYKIGYFHLIKQDENNQNSIDTIYTLEQANQQLLVDLEFCQNYIEALFKKLRLDYNNYPENMKMLLLLLYYIEKNEQQISHLFFSINYQTLYKKIVNLKLCTNKMKHKCEKKAFIKQVCEFFKSLFHCSNGEIRKQ